MRGAELVRASLAESAEAKRALPDGEVRNLLVLARAVAEACRKGRKVLLFGNGGSAADAQHIAAELVGKFRRSRRALRALALTTNTSIMTAVANDFSYEDVFARQVEAWAEEGDVAVGISTSGNSASVLKALDAARRAGARAFGLTGKRGGRMADHAEEVIHAPTDDTQRIQEVHITLGHILCHLVEEELFGEGWEE